MLFSLGQLGKNISPSRIGTGWYPLYNANYEGAYYDFKLLGNIV